MRDGRRKEQEEGCNCSKGCQAPATQSKAAPLTVRQAGEEEERRKRGRAGWHSLVVSASKNEKLHVASGAAIVVSNCLGYFTLTIDRNDAQ